MDTITPQAAATLFVVGTPIGNLDDFTPRAAGVLGNVTVIAAEDTRRTRGLLSRIGVKTPVIAYHDHNEAAAATAIVERLLQGDSVALVSDAGMPLISDPGYDLVSQAHARGVPVVSVPGPCAVTAALSVSGLPTDRYAFEGFLPRRSAARAARLQALGNDPRTLVFFESVHRLETTLAAMADAWGGDRRAVICRELTKLHEQTVAGSLAGLAAMLGAEIPLLGEFVVLVAGAPAASPAKATDVMRILTLLAAEMSLRDAVRLTAKLTNLPRNDVYRLAHQLPATGD